MSDLQLFSNAFATLDGTVVTMATTIAVNKNPAMNEVATLALGFAGVTLGAAKVEISIENAVPSEDFEQNLDQFAVSGRVIEVGVIMAGRQTVQKGFCTMLDYQAGVDKPSSLSMKFLCSWSNFE